MVYQGRVKKFHGFLSMYASLSVNKVRSTWSPANAMDDRFALWLSV